MSPIFDKYLTFSTPNPVTDPRLRKLCRRLDRCSYSEQYLATIRRIARTRHPQAIEILAALLDSPGPVGRAAVRGLVSFGFDAVPEVRRVLRESLDGDAIEHATTVLQRLGVPLEEPEELRRAA
jgi:hypothetical protein